MSDNTTQEVEAQELTKRIRYNRDCERAPMDTLVTFKQGDTIHFGIAMCNFKAGDSFRKSEGRKLAEQRALDEINSVSPPSQGFYVAPSGLQGQCHVSFIRALLGYFESINHVLLR